MQSCTEGPFPFPYVEFSSLLKNPRAKQYIFPDVHSLPAIPHAYMQDAPLEPVYIGICAKNEKWCRVSMSRQEIYDPWPYIYWKRSDSALQFHLKVINGPIPSYGKEEKKFKFESEVTLEKLFTSY
jgi:hypothetical protein